MPLKILLRDQGAELPPEKILPARGLFCRRTFPERVRRSRRQLDALCSNDRRGDSPIASKQRKMNSGRGSLLPLACGIDSSRTLIRWPKKIRGTAPPRFSGSDHWIEKKGGLPPLPFYPSAGSKKEVGAKNSPGLLFGVAPDPGEGIIPPLTSGPTPTDIRGKDLGGRSSLSRL